jgi:hypothetical protein
MMKKTETNRSQKPLLTGENVNRRLSTILRQKENADQVSQLKSDWRAYVEDQFHLTSIQKQHLANIPTDEVNQIQRALNQAVDQGGTIQLKLPLEVRLATAGADAEGELTITVDDTSARAIKIPILHCRFDADCTNWKCGPGPA